MRLGRQDAAAVPCGAGAHAVAAADRRIRARVAYVDVPAGTAADIPTATIFMSARYPLKLPAAELDVRLLAAITVFAVVGEGAIDQALSAVLVGLLATQRKATIQVNTMLMQRGRWVNFRCQPWPVADIGWTSATGRQLSLVDVRCRPEAANRQFFIWQAPRLQAAFQTASRPGMASGLLTRPQTRRRIHIRSGPHVPREEAP